MPVNDVCEFMHDSMHQPGCIIHGIGYAHSIGAWWQRTRMAETRSWFDPGAAAEQSLQLGQSSTELVAEANNTGGHGDELSGKIPGTQNRDARFAHSLAQDLLIFEFRIARSTEPISACVAMRLVPAVIPAPFFLPASRVAGRTGRISRWIDET